MIRPISTIEPTGRVTTTTVTRIMPRVEVQDLPPGPPTGRRRGGGGMLGRGGGGMMMSSSGGGLVQARSGGGKMLTGDQEIDNRLTPDDHWLRDHVDQP